MDYVKEASLLFGCLGVWWRQHFDKAGLLLFLKMERENRKRDKPDDSGEA
ncbi:hypothetical protein [Paenibacillus sp. FJAT-26967]|nr:hypothetical protein [Paenibacillus sp. FJAT-26967]